MSHINNPPAIPYDTDKADQIWATLCDLQPELNDKKPFEQVWRAIFGNSPHLALLAERFPDYIQALSVGGIDAARDALLTGLKAPRPDGETKEDLMVFLRQEKARLSLLTSYADVSGQWQLKDVTQVLSNFADATVDIAVAHLLQARMRKGELGWPGERDEAVTPALCRKSGLVILGMGKLGAHELNYSSDIDLIVFYDPNVPIYTGRKDLKSCYVRLTQELVQIMDQWTMHGYVFRTDLRLRPDPGATPVAISVEAAEHYYHSLAANWERSAMIKARAIAGDKVAGNAFLRDMSPWVWRKNMDFSALSDIAAIKNQINRHYDQDKDRFGDFNVKLGQGGIREIEFFVQVNQLLHAGRHPELRRRETLPALDSLVDLSLITAIERDQLRQAYIFLRTLEHRLQMVDDQQTHSIPQGSEDQLRLALFMGFKDISGLRDTLDAHTTRVKEIYDALLPDEGKSYDTILNDAQIQTLLGDNGYQDTTTSFAAIENMCRGRYRALKTDRAKSLFNQCLPDLICAFGKAPNPDAALRRFDGFVSKLPAGVQLFSMLRANPGLFGLLSRIMSLAPALAETLSKNSALWETVLEPHFFEPVEDADFLRDDLKNLLRPARDYQDVLDIVRRFVAEYRFRIGVHLLEALVDVRDCGAAMTRIADTVLTELVPYVEQELARRHGSFPGGGIAVLALGKYGGGELTHTSDLDIVFLYHTEDMSQSSDGAKPLMPSQYFSRLGQNIITAITALTPEGRLYEVDTRLRPSGSQGPLVVTLRTFEDYYRDSAWTWEHMALTRARVILAPEAMRKPLQKAVESVLCTERDSNELLRAAADMRRKLFDGFGSENPLELKHCRGGLVDMEFIVQYLLLRDGPGNHALFRPEIEKALTALKDHGSLSTEQASLLSFGHMFMQNIQSVLRLCLGDKPPLPSEITDSLKAVIAKATGVDNFDFVFHKLIETQQEIHRLYRTIISGPANELTDSDEGGSNHDT